MYFFRPNLFDPFDKSRSSQVYNDKVTLDSPDLEGVIFTAKLLNAAANKQESGKAQNHFDINN